jgi:hypothetical protein
VSEQWTEKKLSRNELQAAEKVRRGKHTAFESDSRADKSWAVEKAKIEVDSLLNAVRSVAGSRNIVAF